MGRDETGKLDSLEPPIGGDPYRRLLHAIADGFCVIEMIFDEAGEPKDWHYIETSPAFELQSGIAGALGRRGSDFPDPLFSDQMRHFAEVVRTGKPQHFLDHSPVSGRWLDVHVLPFEETANLRLAVLLANITESRLIETALRMSETRFRCMADSVPQIIWGTDSLGYPEFFNKQWFLYTGAAEAPQHLLNTNFSYLHPDDAALTSRRFAEARQSGKSFEVEHRILGRDGIYRWFLTRGEPVWETDTGELLRWIGASTNIHDRKLAEAALAASEQRLRLIVENARDYAIFVMDPEGFITGWWPGAAHVFGWNAEEIVGCNCDIIFTDEDRAAGAPQMEIGQSYRTGSAPDVRWHLRKDGSRVFIDGTVMALHDPDGDVQGFLKIGQDVTERRAAEDALRFSEARFRQFGTAASDLLWIMDAETLRFEYASPASASVLGIEPEALEGGQTSWENLAHPDDRQKVTDHFKRIQSGERDATFFRIFHPSDGDVRWISNTGFPLRKERGQVQSIAGIAADVTEEQENRDRIRILISELHHRTRNLLSVIQAVAERTLSASDSLEDFRSRFYPRLGALARVNEILSRLQTGERITFDQLLRAELTAHAVMDFGGSTGRIALDGPEGIRLRSSQVQTLALALHELCTNSLKYGALAHDAGRLSLRWTEERTHTGERRLVFIWDEQGLALAPSSVVDRGFGRQLIERALPRQLRTAVDYRIEPDCVRCTIALPLSVRPPT